VLPFFKDLIPHLCDRPSSLSKQVLRVFFFVIILQRSCGQLPLMLILRNSGCPPLQPLSSKSFSSLALHLYRRCVSSGSSSQGGCCRRFYRGMSRSNETVHIAPLRHLSSYFPSFFQLLQYCIEFSSHSALLQIVSIDLSPQISPPFRYSKAHRDTIKRVWPPSLDARAPVQVGVWAFGGVIELAIIHMV
jgi:hypothetical protein